MQNKKIHLIVLFSLLVSSLAGCYVCAGERIPLLKQKDVQQVFPTPSPK